MKNFTPPLPAAGDWYQPHFASELHAWRGQGANTHKPQATIPSGDHQTCEKDYKTWILRLTRAIELHPKTTIPQNHDQVYLPSRMSWTTLQTAAKSNITTILQDTTRKWEAERAAWLVWGEVKTIHTVGNRRIDYRDAKGMVYPPEKKSSERLEAIVKAIEGNACVALQVLRGCDLGDFVADPEAYAKGYAEVEEKEEDAGVQVESAIRGEEKHEDGKEGDEDEGLVSDKSEHRDSIVDAEAGKEQVKVRRMKRVTLVPPKWITGWVLPSIEIEIEVVETIAREPAEATAERKSA